MCSRRNVCRKAGLALAAALAISVLCSPAAAAQSDASPPEDDTRPLGAVTATVNGQGAPALLDADRGTNLVLREGDEVTLEADTPFSQLYLVWDTPPGGYELRTGPGEVLAGGQHGFLHDYTALGAPTGGVTLLVLEGEATLCDAYLFEDGLLPGWVQRWEPMLEKADLLVLPTHADDEHLFFGGTLPTYAGERGLDVQAAYLTNHWGEAYRTHELLNGLWTVGVRNYPLISDFPDLYAMGLEAAQELYDQEEVLAWQVETIRRFRPEVIVGHDINGEYGHGVHMLNALTLLEAVELTGDAGAFPESARAYGTWDVPKTYLHLWPENTLTMDWGVPLEAFGGATALDMAVEGFAQHTSQQTYFSVEDFGPYDCRLFGLARSTVGPDKEGGDFFENIDLTAGGPQAGSSLAPTPSEASAEASAPSSPPSAADAPAPPDEAGGGSVSPAVWGGLALAVALAVVILAAGLTRRGRRKKK